MAFERKMGNKTKFDKIHMEISVDKIITTLSNECSCWLNFINGYHIKNTLDVKIILAKKSANNNLLSSL